MIHTYIYIIIFIIEINLWYAVYTYYISIKPTTSINKYSYYISMKTLPSYSELLYDIFLIAGRSKLPKYSKKQFHIYKWRGKNISRGWCKYYILLKIHCVRNCKPRIIKIARHEETWVNKVSQEEKRFVLSKKLHVR